MAELSNKTLAVLVFAALVVVIAGTVIQLGSFGGLTGFATSDQGYVNLTVNGTLAIQVNATNSSINFGACVPRPATTYSCVTNDSISCDNSPLGNCTGDVNSPQYIRLHNVGNIDANITVSSECTAAQLIGGTSPDFSFVTTQCNGTAISSWTTFTGSSQNACANLSYLGGNMLLYANVTIPNNAVGGTGPCADGVSTLTFTATTSLGN